MKSIKIRKSLTALDVADALGVDYRKLVLIVDAGGDVEIRIDDDTFSLDDVKKSKLKDLFGGGKVEDKG
jgi:hypothetical protein